MEKVKTEDIKKVHEIFKIENTGETIKNTRSLIGEIRKYDNYLANRHFISPDNILACKDLEEMRVKYAGCHIENTDIYIDINKRPVKGGAVLYTAIGYDFIEFLKSNAKKTKELKKRG